MNSTRAESLSLSFLVSLVNLQPHGSLDPTSNITHHHLSLMPPPPPPPNQCDKPLPNPPLTPALHVPVFSSPHYTTYQAPSKAQTRNADAHHGVTDPSRRDPHPP